MDVTATQISAVPPQATQTAEQINGPQVGRVTLPTAKPLSTTEPPKPDTAGWWSCRDLSGSVPRVIAEVEGMADIPQHWKDAIKADILARCGSEFNFVYLDAHYSVGAQGAVLQYHAVPDKKLL